MKEVRYEENDGGFLSSSEKSRREEKNTGGREREREEKNIPNWRKRVGLKENLRFSSGTSHSSSPCKQFSGGK